MFWKILRLISTVAVVLLLAFAALSILSEPSSSSEQGAGTAPDSSQPEQYNKRFN